MKTERKFCEGCMKEIDRFFYKANPFGVNDYIICKECWTHYRRLFKKYKATGVY